VTRLQNILERFMDNLYCMDATFVSDDMLDQLPTRSCIGKTPVGGIDLNKPRSWAVLQGALALACSPDGFTVKQFAAAVGPILATSMPNYGMRQAAYDLKKLRAKNLLTRAGKCRRYCIPPTAIRAVAALVILREKVLRPILAGVAKTTTGRKPQNRSIIDQHYATICQAMITLFQDLRITA
jgi:hypothetical protein